MDTTYSKNFNTAKKHHLKFWDRNGMVLVIRLPVQLNSTNSYSMEYLHTNVAGCVESAVEHLKGSIFLADTLPIVMTDYGCISQAELLGATPVYDTGTIWYNPFIHDAWEGELTFDRNHKFWLFLEETAARIKDYDIPELYISTSGYSPGLDCLGALRGTENLLYDLIDRPCWVHSMMRQITDTYKEIYNLTYDMTKDADGHSSFGYFNIWGKGRTTQMQCDISGMLSAASFNEFQLPYFIECCELHDNTLYHLDGPQALHHLDALLSVSTLSAVQYTPVGIPGSDPSLYPIYYKILSAGKAVQVVNVEIDEIESLLGAIGTKGVFLTLRTQIYEEALHAVEIVESLR